MLLNGILLAHQLQVKVFGRLSRVYRPSFSTQYGDLAIGIRDANGYQILVACGPQAATAESGTCGFLKPQIRTKRLLLGWQNTVLKATLTNVGKL